MSKNIKFLTDENEHDMQDDFLDFVKEYNKKITQEESYNTSKVVLVCYAFVLLLGEYLLLNHEIVNQDWKVMNMVALVIFAGIASSKDLVIFLSSRIGKKERKKDIQVLNEKLENWLDMMKDEKNRFKIAKLFISQSEMIEQSIINSSKKDNLVQQLKEFRESIYTYYSNIFEEEKNIIMIMIIIMEQIEQLENLQNHANNLIQEDEQLNKIKSNVAQINNQSVSFSNNNKKYVAFKK